MNNLRDQIITRHNMLLRVYAVKTVGCYGQTEPIMTPEQMDNLSEAFADQILALLPQWINTSSMLPSIGNRLKWFSANKKVVLGYYLGGDNWYRHNGVKMDMPEYWQPYIIPEPPE